MTAVPTIEGPDCVSVSKFWMPEGVRNRRRNTFSTLVIANLPMLGGLFMRRRQLNQRLQPKPHRPACNC